MNANQVRTDPSNRKQLMKHREKFYLVGITGRTSFILENLRGTKFKITIGNMLKCSCNTGTSKQCIHTLHVLLQIFYLPQSHPLLSCDNYTDSQLRYIMASRRIHLNKISDFLKYVKARRNVIMQEQEEEDDDDENLCVICHMQIVKCDATITCTTVCHNTFHLDCFTQWAKHEIKKNGTVKCPLCRDEKAPDIIQEMRHKECEHLELLNSQKVGKEFNYYCDGCELSEIKQNQIVYKCVECQDVTLCESCFRIGRHIKHSFMRKQADQNKWRQCEDRKGKRKMDSDLGYVRIKLKNYRRWYNFLACSIPCYFSKNTRWNVNIRKKLDIKFEDLECIMCSDKQKAFLRRFHCGHFIHHACLRRRIEKGKFYCKLDGQKYLLGYEALLKNQLLNKKVEIQQNDDSESQQQEKQERNSPQRLRTPTKTLLKQDKRATSCDSRRKSSKGKKSLDNHKSKLSNFHSNDQGRSDQNK